MHRARVHEPRHPRRPGEVALGSGQERGRKWWLDYEDAAGAWKPLAAEVNRLRFGLDRLAEAPGQVLPSAVPSFLEACAKLAGEAAARGDFERARALIEKAAQVAALQATEAA